jgi:hypothetical protein
MRALGDIAGIEFPVLFWIINAFELACLLLVLRDIQENLDDLNLAWMIQELRRSHLEQQITDTLAPGANLQDELRHLLALWG